MDNIFDTYGTLAIDAQGQSYGSQGQYNVFNRANSTSGIDNNNEVIGNPLFRNAAALDFTPMPGSVAIDAGLSELGEVDMGNSLQPIVGPDGVRVPSIPFGGQPRAPRSNVSGGYPSAVGQPGDIVTLPGLPSRTFDDQWVPAIPGSARAQAGPATNAATFWYAPDPGERRDQRGFLRVDDPTTATVGAGARPVLRHRCHRAADHRPAEDHQRHRHDHRPDATRSPGCARSTTTRRAASPARTSAR